MAIFLAAFGHFLGTFPTILGTLMEIFFATFGHLGGPFEHSRHITDMCDRIVCIGLRFRNLPTDREQMSGDVCDRIVWASL